MKKQIEPLKLVFMGTPKLAATILKQLSFWNKGRLVVVYCQPDRPSGRKHKVQYSPVKEVALELGLPIQQPVNFKDHQEIQILKEYEPDFLLVAAYGIILPQYVLDIPKIAPLNVHASLLPFYRGAAPIQRAIMAGEIMTGVTIMHIEQELDAGPIYGQKVLSISNEDTTETIYDQISVLGGNLLIDILEQAEQGRLPEAIPQDNTRASYAAKLSKSDGYIQWGKTAQEVHNLIRGVNPWPGAQTQICFDNREPLWVMVALGEIGSIDDIPQYKHTSFIPGSILGLVGEAIAISCIDKPYLVKKIQPAGGKNLEARAFWNGYIQGTNGAFCCSLKK